MRIGMVQVPRLTFLAIEHAWIVGGCPGSASTAFYVGMTCEME